MLTISDFMRRAKGCGAGRIAVAAAHDADVLRAVIGARREGISEPVLFGEPEQIRTLLEQLCEAPGDYDIRAAKTDEDCAKAAVACVASGEAGTLMKGLLGTATLMRAVLDKEHGIRTQRLISHVMFYEPAGHKLIAVTDGGMNPFPDLEKKADILENAAALLCTLGYASINAACVCGAEVVNPKIPSMLDADALAHMQTRWAPYHMNVIGPVGLDLAVSPEACHHKHYSAPGAGEADILLVPTYEVGNALGKALSLFGGAKSAGIIVGASAPIVLVSRSDSAGTKQNSIALAALAARAGK